MTTLLKIPGATAYHLPAPGVAPVALAEGELVLALIPSFPPERPHESVTLTVGGSTFVLTKNAPVQRTNSKNEHPSLVFTPAPLADGRSIGQVRIDFRDSRNPDEWEMTEAAYTGLQAELKSFGLWEDKVLFVDDEYELGKVDTTPKMSWGETISSNFMWGVSKMFGRKPQEPGLPTSVPAAEPGVHSTLGPAPPPKAGAAPQSVPQAAPSSPNEFRALASHSWTQASIAAQGIGAAAVAAGANISHQVRDAVDHLGAPSVPDKDGPPTPKKDSPKTDAAALPVAEPPTVVKKEDIPVIKPETTEGKTTAADAVKVDAEDKVSEVAAKVAAVKIEDNKLVEKVEKIDKVEEFVVEDKKIEKIAEVKEAEKIDDAKIVGFKEVETDIKVEDAPKAEKSEAADDVDMLDSTPATPAETETPSESATPAEPEDEDDKETGTTEATKTAPKKKNKKKGKKGKN